MEDGGGQNRLLEPTRLFVTYVTGLSSGRDYSGFRSKMGRISKSVFLVVLLLLTGVPGYASRLCDMPFSSHAHACCMGHHQHTASLSGTTSTASFDSSCCKVVPPGSVITTTIATSDRSDDVTYAHLAMSAVALDLPASTIRSNRSSPHSAKLRHSPTRALLCTFLV